MPGARALPASLAVVGGGSVTAALLHHLVLAAEAAPLATPRVVRVYEPRPQLGAGTAYGADLDSNLLNVPVAAMSVAGDDRTHFQRWLQAQGILHFHGRPITGSTFVSRPLFGRYLEAVCQALIPRARLAGVQIEQVRGAVVSVSARPEGGFGLRTADGLAHLAERTVLSLGNLPATTYPALRGLPGYFASPYPAAQMVRHVDRRQAVGVLGTSLSAVDAVVALLAQGHQGPIHAVSRQGRLPCVRGSLNEPMVLRPGFVEAVAQRRAAGERLTLEALAAWLHQEGLALTGDAGAQDLALLTAPVPEAADFLDDEIERASQRARPWQTFGNALNAVIDSLWQLLDEPGRERFEREWRPLWMARRVSFPLENARCLREALARGQLQVRGGLARVEPVVAAPTGAQPAGFELVLDAQGPWPAERRVVQRLINATPFSTDVRSADDPLLAALQAQGLAVADRWGGFRADPGTGCLLGADGQPNPGLTALGSLVAGTYFWTNAMEVNARLAMGQAQRLVAAWAGQPAPSGAMA